MVVALLAVWGLVQDALHTANGGSIDLRNRITGVRLAADGKDPYFYKWNRTEPERYCDPFNSPASPVSHTTVTPVTLMAFLPFRNLSYPVSQWLWFGVEYAALGLGFLAWARSVPRQHWLWGGLLTCLFCLSPHWRLHVDRGQSYVVYAALFLGMVLAGSRQAGSNRNGNPPAGRTAVWLEGAAGSLLALLRPTFGAVLGLAVARKKLASAAAFGAGLLLWAVLPVLLAGASIWNNYSRAMGIHARNYLEKIRYPNASFRETDSIEGIPVGTFLNLPRIPFSDTSLYKLLNLGPAVSPGLLLGVWGLAAAAAGFLLMRRGLVGTARFWWALSAWLVIGDYLLPAYRYPYNNILIWPLLLLGLAALPGRGRTVWITASSSLLLLHAATWFLPKNFIPWPGAAALLLALAAAVWSLLPAPPLTGPARDTPSAS